MGLTDAKMQDIADALKVCDIVGFRHFPDAFGNNYPIVDRNGTPIAIASTENRTSRKYLVQGKRGRVGRPTADKVRDVYANTLELGLDMIAHYAEDILLGMIDAAVGAKTIRTDRNGNEIEVYVRPPDAKAGDMLLNRLYGKPSEDRTVTATVETTEKVHVYVPDNGRRLDLDGRTEGERRLLDAASERVEEPAIEVDFVIHPEEFTYAKQHEVNLHEFS